MVAAAERWELSFCRAGPLQRWEANEPAHEEPASGWADASAGSASSMESKEGAGGTSTALLCAPQAAAWPAGIFTRSHRVTMQPSPNTFYPPSASINARTAVAPPSTLQLFFPCRQFQALPSVCKKSFIRLKTATAELVVKAQSKLHIWLPKLQDMRCMFRVQSAKCYSTAWRNQPVYTMKQSSVR